MSVSPILLMSCIPYRLDSLTVTWKNFSPFNFIMWKIWLYHYSSYLLLPSGFSRHLSPVADFFADCIAFQRSIFVKKTVFTFIFMSVCLYWSLQGKLSKINGRVFPVLNKSSEAWWNCWTCKETTLYKTWSLVPCLSALNGHSWK